MYETRMDSNIERLLEQSQDDDLCESLDHFDFEEEEEEDD